MCNSVRLRRRSASIQADGDGARYGIRVAIRFDEHNEIRIAVVGEQVAVRQFLRFNLGANPCQYEAERLLAVRF